MTATKGDAPAKVNLTLHVTGRRGDGYHLIDSLVVFADVADQLTVAPASDLRLSVSGPFAQGVPTDQRNLVLRAALTLQRVRNVTQGAAITLEKRLPNAAGIGGGSADAAAVIRLLAQLWGVRPLGATAPEAVALGADVPACLTGPGALRVSGIGDVLEPIPDLPNCALVLVNPRISVPTTSVFDGLQSKSNSPMDQPPYRADFDGFASWLQRQRNDLLPPARLLAPEIDVALKQITALPAVAAAGMSGSGATCYALVRDMAVARQVARVVQVSHMDWWVAPAAVLTALR